MISASILPSRTESLTLAAILGIMALLIFGSSAKDAAIFDETAHTGAGFSYVKELDYRINPEHPPLIKDLAGLSLFLAHPKTNFPTDTKAWNEEHINDRQWNQGRIFLYESGNNPDTILFWMRLPVIILALIFGIFIFFWTRGRFGQTAAFLALIFYAFSPTVIAHSRFVTTDLGASLVFFGGIVMFIRLLENPSWKNTLWAGIVFGLAESVKFSLILLVPIYFGIALVWALAHRDYTLHRRIGMFFILASRIATLGAVGLIVIWLLFAPHLLNYPAAKNIADASEILRGFRIPMLVNFDLWLLDVPFLRPIGQYLFGLMMITQRAAGGNTQYFLGEITSKGSHLYFPILYLVKETLAFHLLTLIALFSWISSLLARRGAYGARIANWISGHPAEFSFAFTAGFYLTYSSIQPLNIGVRHILPMFAFIYVLVARRISLWLASKENPQTPSLINVILQLLKNIMASAGKTALVAILVLWLAATSITAYPNYLSYFNALGGGTENGYKIATDSNYDWGQDLKRLAEYARSNNIQTLALDYFGGGKPERELGSAFVPWWPSKGPAHGYFAISANALMGAYGRVGEGFSRKPEDSYDWLKRYEPIGRAGKSIFIYKLPE